MSPVHRACFAVVALTVVGTAALPLEVDAGSAEAWITCTAKDSGEKLEGLIPRDGWELDLAFDDGKGHAHAWTDAEALTMWSEVKDHVLIMQITGTPQLTFWALPKTMKVESKRGEEHARFDAKITVVGLPGDTAPRSLRLACKYDYEI